MRELAPDVLCACQTADAAAFRALVELYQDRVYALASALVGSEAGDVAQETFLRVHRAIPRFDPAGPARLSTWILTITRRLCRDFAEKTRPLPLTEGAGPEQAADERPGPHQTLEDAERLASLRAAFWRLPAEQRSVIALKVWDELEYEEIAAVEEIPIGTVRSRLARARAALAAALAEPEPKETIHAKRR